VATFRFNFFVHMCNGEPSGYYNFLSLNIWEPNQKKYRFIKASEKGKLHIRGSQYILLNIIQPKITPKIFSPIYMSAWSYPCCTLLIYEQNKRYSGTIAIIFSEPFSCLNCWIFFKDEHYTHIKADSEFSKQIHEKYYVFSSLFLELLAPKNPRDLHLKLKRGYIKKTA
jgi:hypothetical protein